MLQQVLENPQPMPEPAAEVDVIPRPDSPVPDSAAAAPDAAPAEDSTARLDAPPTLLAPPILLPPVAAASDKCQDANSNAGMPVPLAAQDATTPAATTELKPARRFTRSLLKNKPDEEEAATPTESQGSKDASIDSTLLSQRRFTRSLLKTKVDNSLVGSEDVPDTASQSPPSVKKMEMKMSKKVACLTKHPGNIRELFNTGLLEGVPVMYMIPRSKVRDVYQTIFICQAQQILCFTTLGL